MHATKPEQWTPERVRKEKPSLPTNAGLATVHQSGMYLMARLLIQTHPDREPIEVFATWETIASLLSAGKSLAV